MNVEQMSGPTPGVPEAGVPRPEAAKPPPSSEQQLDGQAPKGPSPEAQALAGQAEASSDPIATYAGIANQAPVDKRYEAAFGTAPDILPGAKTVTSPQPEASNTNQA